jgi:hypothetical protein
MICWETSIGFETGRIYMILLYIFTPELVLTGFDMVAEATNYVTFSTIHQNPPEPFWCL